MHEATAKPLDGLGASAGKMGSFPALSDMKSEKVLELQSVQKVFKNDILKKNQHVLNNVSLAFYQNCTNALIGHNGAGKTTTIRVILGLIKPDSGKVLFHGRAMEQADKSKIGYMPETNRLPQALTPEELLRFQVQRYGIHWSNGVRSTIEEDLRKVGLWEHRKKLIGKLSKGMGRRLAWVQSIIHRPEMLILDEPLSGLDPLGRRDMRQWIIDFRRDGKTLIFCVHDLKLVSDLADHIIIMRNGKVAYSSDMDENTDHGAVGYVLDVSKTDQLTIERMGKELGLDAGRCRPNSDGSLRITFSSYQLAASWCQQFLQRSVEVLNFGSLVTDREERLLQYFDKG